MILRYDILEIMQRNDNTKHAHFVGIAGVGMSAVATLLKEKGWKISGSDEGCHPPISDYLKQENLDVSGIYAADNVTRDVDLIVAGGNAKISPGKNPELNTARERNIPIKTFPEVLNDLTKNKHNILAVGSYGKSTCATLLAWCLIHAGKDPSYFIGAIPLQMSRPAHISSSDVFVLEGDEYPTSSVDPTSKFLYYNPADVLLVSGEHDHVNVFPTTDSYLKPFRKLLKQVPENGIIVGCLDNQNVAELLAPHKDKSVTYGLDENNNPGWTATDIQRGPTTTFNLRKDNAKIATIKTKLLGDHNIQNIVGVGALLFEKKLLTPDEFASAIAEFQGIARRLDQKTTKSSVLAYEGFGSSRDKARSAIAAMRAHFPDKRLIAIFEPHSFSLRNRLKVGWYDDMFDQCDHVALYKPPQVIGANAHEGEEKKALEQLSQAEIAERIRKSGILVTTFADESSGFDALKQLLKPGDAVIILTSGHFDGMLAKLPAFIEKEFPETK